MDGAIGWAWTLSGRKTRTMTEDETAFLLSMMVMDKAGDAGEVARLDEQAEGCFVYAVLKKRIEAYKARRNPALDVSVPAMAFCASLCDSPGKAVMWAYMLNELFCKDGNRVTTETLACEFPMGFPTEQSMSEAWNEQKVKPEQFEPGMSDNGLDNFGNWSVTKVPVRSGPG